MKPESAMWWNLGVGGNEDEIMLWGWGSRGEISTSVRRGRQIALPMCMHGRMAMWAHSQKAAVSLQTKTDFLFLMVF